MYMLVQVADTSHSSGEYISCKEFDEVDEVFEMQVC
jgi:hypothetical protein